MTKDFDLYEAEHPELKHETCEHCGGNIYYGNESFEQDDCICIDGVYVCRDCITAYMLDNYRARLEV